MINHLNESSSAIKMLADIEVRSTCISNTHKGKAISECSEEDLSRTDSFDGSLCDGSSIGSQDLFDSQTSGMRSLFAVDLFGSSCTSICGSASAIQELDRNGIWVSSLDLKQEDSELLHLKDDADLSELDFPSPSFNSCRNLCSEPWSSSRNFQSDEPLFWPYDKKLYNFFELGNNFFCISPRKDMRKDGVNYDLKPAKVEPMNIKSPPTCRNSSRRDCGRRIETTPKPKKSNAECKTTVSENSSIQGCGRALSRLSRSSAESSTSTRGGSSIKEESLWLEFKGRKMKQIDLAKKSLLEFEANCLQEFLVEGFTIEKLVGLDEFDGHQGLNVDSSLDFDFGVMCEEVNYNIDSKMGKKFVCALLS